MDRHVASSPPVDFQRLFESAPGLYLVLNPSLEIIAVSDAYLEATMTKREELIGKGIFEAFPDNPDDPSATGVANLRASLNRVSTKLVADSMAVQKYDIRRPEEEGGGFEVRYWSPKNSPILDGNKLAYIVHRVEDVTEYVKLQQQKSEQVALTEELREGTARMEAEILARSQELRELNDKLEAANNAKNSFLSRVSHELRTPLASILGFTELLQRSPLGEKEQQFLTIILRAGRHLLELLNEVLDISRIEAGTFSLSVTPLPIATFLAEAAELQMPLAKARSIQIDAELTQVKGVYVSADPQRLKQVLINLLSNAIKFSESGDRVILSAEVTENASLRIQVTDTGPGISQEDLARLFTPFERLDAASKGIEGTGLGLAVSQGLVEAMNGTIGVTSAPGEGSTFWIELPITEPAAITQESEDAPLAAYSYQQTKRILYIEDVDANVSLLEHILNLRPGTELISARLGSIGIELASKQLPDLIFLDLHLPDLDGVDVVQRLQSKSETKDIPIIVLSADATRHQQKELLDAGAKTYLTKPIGVRQLLSVLDLFFD
ncbi:MAG: hybrid sensor histidine kinase/response regulator [Actinomycetota bacterium]